MSLETDSLGMIRKSAWFPMGAMTVAVLCAATYHFAYGDEYRRVPRPVDGRGIRLAPPRDPSVCVLWGKNLNYFAKQDKPLSCDRPVDPQFKGLSRPEWTKLDPREHIALVRKLDRLLFYDNPLRPRRAFVEEEWRKRLEGRFREGSVELWTSRLDLNGDGHPEIVLRYGSLPCEPRRGKPAMSPGGKFFFVTDEAMEHVQEVTVSGHGAELLIYERRIYAEWIGQSGDAWLNEFSSGVPPAKPSVCHERFLPEQCPIGERPHFAFVRVCQYGFRPTDSH
jgi:hypothetical protein